MLSQLNAGVRQRASIDVWDSGVETVRERWEDSIHQLWEKTRRRRPAGSRLRLIVFWVAPDRDDQEALIRSAQAEGGTVTPVEEWGEVDEAGAVSMSFIVAPTFTAVKDLFLRLCFISETYQADVRGLGLGRVKAVA